MAAAALAKECQTDGDDEKGLEALAEGDDKCLQHRNAGMPLGRGTVKMRLSLNWAVYVSRRTAGKPAAPPRGRHSFTTAGPHANSVASANFLAADVNQSPPPA